MATVSLTRKATDHWLSKDRFLPEDMSDDAEWFLVELFGGGEVKVRSASEIPNLSQEDFVYLLKNNWIEIDKHKFTKKPRKGPKIDPKDRYRYN